MLQAIARLAIAAPRRVVGVAALLTLALAIFGVPVASSLSASGFQDPTSESSRASEFLTEKFGQGDVQMLITVSTPDGVESPAARTAGTEIVDQLSRSPHVVNVTSPWTAPPQAAAELVSKDRTTGLIVAGIVGDEGSQQKYAKELSAQVTKDRDGVTIQTGGVAMVNVQITEQSQRDLLLMESIAIPLSFLVLVWVFGGLLAAALPIAVGGMAIFGALAVLRMISFATDVSIFALNLTAAMGLALAVDYTLLMISRFRDELTDGTDRDVALVRMMVTAGRTVLFSATTVALSMAVMVLFPMHFLKSFAYAGVATVAFAAIAAVVVTPAALVLLGDRLDSLDVRRLVRRVLGRPEPVPQPVQHQFWYRWTKLVLRRAVPLGLAGVAVLVSSRLAVPRGQVGLPRRPRAATLGLRAPSRRRDAQRLRQQLRGGGDHRHPGRRRPDPRATSSDTPPICPACPTSRRYPPRRARSSPAPPSDHRQRPLDRHRAARSSPSTARLRCSPTAPRLSSTACTRCPPPAARRSTSPASPRSTGTASTPSRRDCRWCSG